MMDIWTGHSSATQAGKRAPRIQSTSSMETPDEDVPRSKMSRADRPTTGATLTSAVDEHDADTPDILIVRAPRRTFWFNGPIAELPKREPYIPPMLLSLADEDE